MQRSVTENLWTDQFTHAVVTHSIMLFFFIHCSADRKGHQVCRGPRLLLIPASQPSQEPHCRGGHRWQISGWCGKCHVGVFKRRTSIHPAVYKSCWLKCFNVCVVFLWRTSFQHKPVNLHFWAKMEKSLSQPWEAISHCVFRWMPVWRHEHRASHYLRLGLAVRSPPQSWYPSPTNHHPPTSCMLKITPPSTVSETPWSRNYAKVRKLNLSIFMCCVITYLTHFPGGELISNSNKKLTQKSYHPLEWLICRQPSQ